MLALVRGAGGAVRGLGLGRLSKQSGPTPRRLVLPHAVSPTHPPGSHSCLAWQVLETVAWIQEVSPVWTLSSVWYGYFW